MFSSDIKAIVSVVVDIHPGHIVAFPVLVALHWSVGPVESNAGIWTSIEYLDTRGWLWFCMCEVKVGRSKPPHYYIHTVHNIYSVYSIIIWIPSCYVEI